MKTKLLIFAVIVLTCLTTGYFLFALPQAAEESNPYLEEVTQRDFEIEVRSVGTLEAQKAHMIVSEIKGSEARIIYLAENGTFVSKGEVLVRFDPKPFEDAADEMANKVESLTAAVRASEQLLEWEKNEAEQRIVGAEYQNKVAVLDLKRLVEGEGPLKLAQFQDDFDKIALELKHYQAYEDDLRGLEQEGISSTVELERATEDVKLLMEQYQSAKRKLDSYQNYVLPVLVESGKAKVKSSELKIDQVRQANVHKIANSAAILQQTKAKLKAVEASLQKAQLELGKTTIRAPFDGLIVHYEAYRNGELRVPREGDSIIVNQPILFFPDISKLVVKSNIREVDLHKVRLGQSATVYVDAYPTATLEGRLLFVGALAKKSSGGGSGDKYFQVVFSLTTPDDRLRPGMSARVITHVDSVKKVVAIPVQSVFEDSGGDFCYLKNGVTYEKRYITTGRQNEDYVEVLKGLDVGERVSQVHPDNLL